MFLRLETLPAKTLVGNRIHMSFVNNRTGELWRHFMPRRKEIPNKKGSELFSVEVYEPRFFDPFDPEKQFEKWAAIEVTDLADVPGQMESLLIPAGLYALFLHKGPASQGEKTYRHIFGEWLPNSNYKLDNRPHFAVMGEKYKQEDPDSEEEIWIPIKPKSGAAS